MKTYIMMNKEKNRVRITSGIFDTLLSGSLDVEMFHISFTPVKIDNSLVNKIKAWWKGLTVVEVSLKEFTDEHFHHYCGEYVYLQRKTTGEVYRIWNHSCINKPTNQGTLTSYGKVLLPSGRSLPPQDFHIFHINKF